MNLGRIIGEFDAALALVPADLDVDDRAVDPATGPRSREDRTTGHPVIGWRIWLITSELDLGPWVLRSVAQSYYWLGPAAWDPEPPSFQHVHDERNGRYVSPGFHLWRDEAVAKRVALRWLTEDGIPLVYGACELAGRVVEHELGYRTQGVVIRNLKILPDPDLIDLWYLQKAVPQVERLYDCDVEIVASSRCSAVPLWARRKRTDKKVARTFEGRSFGTVFTARGDRRWRIKNSGTRYPWSKETEAVLAAARAMGIEVTETSSASPVNASSYGVRASFLDGGIEGEVGNYWYSPRGVWVIGAKAVLLLALQMGLKVRPSWLRRHELEDATIDRLTRDCGLLDRARRGLRGGTGRSSSKENVLPDGTHHRVIEALMRPTTRPVE
jgi:hypothetical protein